MSYYRHSVPNRGNEHFRDYDGILTAYKFEDEIITFVWDLTDELASGESVSSVANDANSGLTVSASVVASPTITYTITGTGELEAVATLSTARTVKEIFRWEAKDEGDSDY